MQFVKDGPDGTGSMVRTQTEELLQNPKLLQVNRLRPRANLIPAQKEGVYYRNKEDSLFIRPLNGTWRFLYRPADSAADFYREDYGDGGWDTIDVPSMWQYRGYGKCSYPNVQYPIPFNPPYICCENPVGYYRRIFTVQRPAARTVLHFGGVDNAFFAYLNGEFVGFSKGSRLPGEFDVTDKIRDGENTLAVKVFTYSDATYLENQDMLMANGIFRDVYLIETGEVSLWDFRVRASKEEIRVEAALDYHGESGWEIEFSLGGRKAVCPAAAQAVHTFPLGNARLWNAEEPNLYDLTIRLLKNGETAEVHSKRVGIMETRVEGGRFLVNGSPVIIKGVNRHEYDCKNGRAVSVALIEKELRSIKANHFNAIRCSHYTNNPAFYEIAGELGLYVMDEADLETHGCEVTGDQGFLSKDPAWLPAYMDRVVRMLETNKNEACIFMWSIGNEAGQGENLEKCADFIRRFDPTKEINQAQDDFVHPKYTHFRRDGYCSMEHLKTYGPEGYPVLLVEFAHCMGNGPGFLDGYWSYIYTHPQCIGGFVWEFKSHGFYTQDDEGRARYLYGGDFGELSHFSNFSVDGVTMSDGTPKTTWYELYEALAPVYAEYREGVLRVMNTNDFTSLAGMRVKWEICEDYKVLRAGEAPLPAVAPHESAPLPLDLTVGAPVPGARYRVNLAFYDGEKRAAFRQFELPCRAEKTPFRTETFPCEISGAGGRLTVRGDDFCIGWENGLLAHMEKGGRTLLDAPMRPLFMRAPTDNDGIPGWNRRHIRDWEQMLLADFHFWLQDLAVRRENEAVVVEAKGKCLPASRGAGFELAVTYRVYRGGLVLTQIDGRPYGAVPDPLPRIGVCFELDKALGHATWYGRGPRENYSDSKLAAPVGYYEKDVGDMNVPYDVPQETGNHEDTAFVRVTAPDGGGLCAVGSDAFAFSLHDFTLENLTAARHKNELRKADRNYLYLDYRMRGLGSASCGPEPEEPYELHPHAFRFVFALLGDRSAETALALARSDFGTKSQALSGPYRADARVLETNAYGAGER